MIALLFCWDRSKHCNICKVRARPCTKYRHWCLQLFSYGSVRTVKLKWNVSLGGRASYTAKFCLCVISTVLMQWTAYPSDTVEWPKAKEMALSHTLHPVLEPRHSKTNEIVSSIFPWVNLTPVLECFGWTGSGESVHLSLSFPGSRYWFESTTCLGLRHPVIVKSHSVIYICYRFL